MVRGVPQGKYYIFTIHCIFIPHDLCIVTKHIFIQKFKMMNLLKMFEFSKPNWEIQSKKAKKVTILWWSKCYIIITTRKRASIHLKTDWHVAILDDIPLPTRLLSNTDDLHKCQVNILHRLKPTDMGHFTGTHGNWEREKLKSRCFISIKQSINLELNQPKPNQSVSW